MDSEKIRELGELLTPEKRVVVLTGSGISAESGIPTFRGKNGLWKHFRAEDLATPEAFERDPVLVWEWYNWRRRLMAAVEPNPGHRTLARWEKHFGNFVLITQNIDGLHEKAGSQKIFELHGNIWKFRCTREGTISENRNSPLSEIPPRCPACGALLRPHVVWFGESLDPDILHKSFLLSSTCDVFFSVGTSALVQPAASLPLAASEAGAKFIEINPEPTPLSHYADFNFRGKAGEVLPIVDSFLKSPADDI